MNRSIIYNIVIFRIIIGKQTDMSGKSKDSLKMVLTFGIIGFLAGIGLLFSDSKFIGAIASAGLITL